MMVEDVSDTTRRSNTDGNLTIENNLSRCRSRYEYDAKPSALHVHWSGAALCILYTNQLLCISHQHKGIRSQQERIFRN